MATLLSSSSPSSPPRGTSRPALAYLQHLRDKQQGYQRLHKPNRQPPARPAPSNKVPNTRSHLLRLWQSNQQQQQPPASKRRQQNSNRPPTKAVPPPPPKDIPPVSPPSKAATVSSKKHASTSSRREQTVPGPPPAPKQTSPSVVKPLKRRDTNHHNNNKQPKKSGWTLTPVISNRKKPPRAPLTPSSTHSYVSSSGSEASPTTSSTAGTNTSASELDQLFSHKTVAMISPTAANKSDSLAEDYHDDDSLAAFEQLLEETANRWQGCSQLKLTSSTDTSSRALTTTTESSDDKDDDHPLKTTNVVTPPSLQSFLSSSSRPPIVPPSSTTKSRVHDSIILQQQQEIARLKAALALQQEQERQQQSVVPYTTPTDLQSVTIPDQEDIDHVPIENIEVLVQTGRGDGPMSGGGPQQAMLTIGGDHDSVASGLTHWMNETMTVPSQVEAAWTKDWQQQSHSNQQQHQQLTAMGDSFDMDDEAAPQFRPDAASVGTAIQQPSGPLSVTNKRKELTLVRDQAVTLTAADGSRRQALYTGPWKHASKQGQAGGSATTGHAHGTNGRFVFVATGDVYQGVVTNTEMHGQGTYTFAKRSGKPQQRPLQGTFSHNVFVG